MMINPMLILLVHRACFLCTLLKTQLIKGFDLFEQNMLEDNFSFPNDQSFDNPLIFETVDEIFSNRELLWTEPILDDYKCN
jgi:hypothetical protein